MGIKVLLTFVDIAGRGVSPEFYACGDATLAGPFMAGGSAIDWEREFCPGAELRTRWSDEEGVCGGPPLYKGANGWYRG